MAENNDTQLDPQPETLGVKSKKAKADAKKTKADTKKKKKKTRKKNKAGKVPHEYKRFALPIDQYPEASAPATDNAGAGTSSVNSADAAGTAAGPSTDAGSTPRHGISVRSLPRKQPAGSPDPQESKSLKGGHVIILGTAHTSVVDGKRSPGGAFREYRFSRQVVDELRDRLTAEGYTVMIDWPADYVVPSKDNKTELNMRTAIVNSICDAFGKAKCIYVSIHVNASGSTDEWRQAHGWEVYTSIGHTRSDDLATYIYNAADEVLRNNPIHRMRPGYDEVKGLDAHGDQKCDVDREKNLAVLSNTQCPAVLTENFFMDNLEDVAFLQSEVGFNCIVELHRRGIIAFLNSGK